EEARNPNSASRQRTRDTGIWVAEMVHLCRARSVTRAVLACGGIRQVACGRRVAGLLHEAEKCAHVQGLGDNWDAVRREEVAQTVRKSAGIRRNHDVGVAR